MTGRGVDFLDGWVVTNVTLFDDAAKLLVDLVSNARNLPRHIE